MLFISSWHYSDWKIWFMICFDYIWFICPHHFISRVSLIALFWLSIPFYLQGLSSYVIVILWLPYIIYLFGLIDWRPEDISILLGHYYMIWIVLSRFADSIIWAYLVWLSIILYMLLVIVIIQSGENAIFGQWIYSIFHLPIKVYLMMSYIS